MLYPITFHPIFKERVWGGRELERLYRKPLPPGVPIGESWEISDRPGDVSVIANGPLAGKDLHWILENHPRDLLGKRAPHAGRFPLLIKILDAREKLSLQVHPPSGKAAALGGEPKTEMWYILRAEPGARLAMGLRERTSRNRLREASVSGDVEALLQWFEVRPGQVYFIPPGTVHALGPGITLCEIQQHADITYRLYDYGRPRELHLDKAVAVANARRAAQGLPVSDPRDGVVAPQAGSLQEQGYPLHG